MYVTGIENKLSYVQLHVHFEDLFSFYVRQGSPSTQLHLRIRVLNASFILFSTKAKFKIVTN